MKSSVTNQLSIASPGGRNWQPSEASSDALRGSENANRACAAMHEAAKANEGIHVAAAAECHQVYNLILYVNE